jgi:hypothetical protein
VAKPKNDTTEHPTLPEVEEPLLPRGGEREIREPEEDAELVDKPEPNEEDGEKEDAGNEDDLDQTE